jgi:AcrR family transcriptional regulator
VSERTTHQIVAAALALVEANGLSGVTMSAIADAAGVARQTLYNHFPDLDAIIGAVLQQHAIEAIDAVDHVVSAAKTHEAKLQALVGHHAGAVGHGRDLQALLAGLGPVVQSQIGEHFEAYRKVIQSVVQGGIADGAFRQELDAESVSVAIQRLLEAGTEIAERSDAATAEAVVWDLISRGVLSSEY